MTQSAMMTEGPQRMRALERANEVRLARADLKRRIAQGDVSAADIILACPWEASTWSVGDLLLSQRRWGSTRCRKFLMRNQINEKKQIGDLTDRQRRLLAEQLETCASTEQLETCASTEQLETCGSTEQLETCAPREFELVPA